VTGTWEALRLPRCSDALLAADDPVEALLDRYAEGYAQRLPEAAQSHLCYLSLHSRRWPDTARRLVATARNLESLELHGLPFRFDPLLLVDAATGGPLLPHLRHLHIPRPSSREDELLLTVEQADSCSQSIAQLLLSYRHQLRRLHVHTAIGSSCWPLLQAAFSCPSLRRCELGINVPSRAVGGRPDVQAMLAALRAEADPPSLPSLPHLHTLDLQLPLSDAELSRALQACPVLLDLSISQKRGLDALQLTHLISQHASETLRVLHVLAMEPLRNDPDAVADPPAPPSLLSPPFPALTAYRADGHMGRGRPSTAAARAAAGARAVAAPGHHACAADSAASPRATAAAALSAHRGLLQVAGDNGREPRLLLLHACLFHALAFWAAADGRTRGAGEAAGWAAH
jgi:hypothetical protein